MNKLLAALFLCAGFLHAQLFTQLTGTVADGVSGEPLSGANLFINTNFTGVTTSASGTFTLHRSLSAQDTLMVSYVGYETAVLPVSGFPAAGQVTIGLIRKIIPSQTVLITASIGNRGEASFTFDKISGKEISNRYTVQDVPQFLASLPSVTAYSEAGNGIGYNYINIRGFDQRRIGISINGIPQNDPEDHNVYWVDFSDILASAGLVQVRRGAGSGISGYPAIGGSVDIITGGFTNKPSYEFSTLFGSWQTRRVSASFSSGLIDNKYAVAARFSQILSSGYRNLAWVKLNSFFFSAVRYNGNFSSQLNFYGGPIADGLVYTGLPKFAVKDKTLRRKNYSYWEEANASITYATERRRGEIENFSQPHLELLNEYRLSPTLKFNSALFMVAGEGFFDYDGSWAPLSYYRITAGYGFPVSGNPDTLYLDNAIIHAYVNNMQYGWLPKLQYDYSGGTLIAGLEWRRHRSLHYGTLQYAAGIPFGVPQGHRYYEYSAARDILSGFLNNSYAVLPRLSLSTELQLVYNRYRLFNEKYIGTDFTLPYFFLNPRLAVNYKLTENQNIYLSVAYISREPRLKNYYDAAESSGGEVPQFARNASGALDYSKPLVHPEKMISFDAGTTWSHGSMEASVNAYLMLFRDEIVRNGQLDRFGQPVTGNMSGTVHSGIELSAQASLLRHLAVYANTTLSRNYISSGSAFIKYRQVGGKAVHQLNLSGNTLGGFPSVLANLKIIWAAGSYSAEAAFRYLGKFYSDNYGADFPLLLSSYPGMAEYPDNINDAAFVTDLALTGEFSLGTEHVLRLQVAINNLFNVLYSSAAFGKEFFPAAERSIYLGARFGI